MPQECTFDLEELDLPKVDDPTLDLPLVKF
jgi:hypothetical protein